MQFIYFLNNHIGWMTFFSAIFGIICLYFGLRLAHEGNNFLSELILNFAMLGILNAIFTYLCSSGKLG